VLLGMVDKPSFHKQRKPSSSIACRPE
jgi:hypothetical protein